MDKETAKEIEELHNNFEAFASRKRKREDAALEDENKRLKREIARLRQSMVSYASFSVQNNQKLAKVKQSNEELETDNKRLKNELEQQVLSKVILQQTLDEKLKIQSSNMTALRNQMKVVRKDLNQSVSPERFQKEAQQKLLGQVEDQERIIKTLEEQARLSKAENQDLQHRLQRLEKFESVSEAASDLKSGLHLAIEAVFELNDNVILVSQQIKNLKFEQDMKTDNIIGRTLMHPLSRTRSMVGSTYVGSTQGSDE
jgi:chromosome segregation ATPase